MQWNVKIKHCKFKNKQIKMVSTTKHKFKKKPICILVKTNLK